ncbi:NAD(P)-dependent oxidoreductase [Nonomuraea sp. JJY05]|uniref:NAD(P)-dependent oxidoreductase n=1 Tax=Nonomuraea sp. JJY05 TaxID=3350255 RepID=UPI00373F4F0D
MLRCAVLDDYQGVALGLADWSRVRATSFRDHFTTQDDLVAALHDHEIVVIMRERTPFPAEVLDRLPNLRLLITSGMRNASVDLAAARPTAYLVNTSRAAIVDQEALVAALRAGRIAGAGLDVFEMEPLPAGHAFRTLPNVLATPHLGYVTELNYATYFREAVEDIDAFLAGAPIRIL